MTRLDLVVGPNGAGKSTFVRFTLAPLWPAATFVNADVIAAQRWPDDQGAHAYEAAEIAAETRRRLIALGRPFIAETVCSHPSKLELVDQANRAGYHVALHVVMVPEDLSVARVAARVAAGGHDVPAAKIRARHQRLWAIVAEAVDRSATATFWDNSRHDGPRMVALFSDGLPVGAPRWPTWTDSALSRRWPSGS